MPFKTVTLSPEQKPKNDSFDRKQLELERARIANRSARHAFLSELFEVPASDFVEADLGQRKYSVVSSNGRSADLVDYMEWEAHILDKEPPYKTITITQEQADRYFATGDSRCAGGGTEHIEFVSGLLGISAEQYDRKISATYTSPNPSAAGEIKLFFVKRKITDV